MGKGLVSAGIFVRVYVCMCTRERERESLQAAMSVDPVLAGKWVSLYVCVCVCAERERERVWVEV